MITFCIIERKILGVRMNQNFNNNSFPRNNNFQRNNAHIQETNESHLESSNSFENEILSDHNVRAFFRKSSSNSNVLFLPGKVLVKSYGFLDKIGYAFLTIGGFIVLGLLRGKLPDENQVIYLIITALICIAIGFVVITLVKTYSVIDYKSKKIYKETQIKGNSFIKTGTININDITEISIDNRETDASVQNFGQMAEDGLKSGNVGASRANNMGFDSAIAFLLKNGKIAYFTEFTSNKKLIESYNVFFVEMAKALKINYKTNTFNHKLVVKKKGPKFYLDFVDYKKVTSDKVAGSILNILIGVLVMLGSIILIFYLIHKYI